MTELLLFVRNLMVEFSMRCGILIVVQDISFDIMFGEVLGVVGEFGAGKLMTGSAIMGLIDRPGWIVQGEVILQGRCIDNLFDVEMCKIWGCKIGMIFQDLLMLLNLLYWISE